MTKRLMKLRHDHRKGVVSLYVVIFTTLLLGVITLSFIRIMMNEQRSASNQDLSQSAYDSALAGIEDARRATIAYQDCLSKGGEGNSTISGQTCASLISEINSGGCDSVAQALYGPNAGGSDGQSLSETSETDELLQAYTCLIVRPNTNDYLGYIAEDRPSKMIPLRVAKIDGSTGAVDQNVEIDHVIIRIL